MDSLLRQRSDTASHSSYLCDIAQKLCSANPARLPCQTARTTHLTGEQTRNTCTAFTSACMHTHSTDQEKQGAALLKSTRLYKHVIEGLHVHVISRPSPLRLHQLLSLSLPAPALIVQMHCMVLQKPLEVIALKTDLGFLTCQEEAGSQRASALGRSKASACATSWASVTCLPHSCRAWSAVKPNCLVAPTEICCPPWTPI